MPDKTASRTYYYARVSSTDQNLQRQLDAFAKLGADERSVITDKQSGKDLDRPGYKALRDQILRRGDTLIVASLDRLSRNKADIKAELEHYQTEGVRVKILDLPTTMMDFPQGQEWVLQMVNNILVEVLGTIAQQERQTIKKRQAEGIAAEVVNANGKRQSTRTGREHGRPSVQKPGNWEAVVAQWHNGEITAVKAMELTGVKRSSFYKLVSGDTQQQGN